MQKLLDVADCIHFFHSHSWPIGSLSWDNVFWDENKNKMILGNFNISRMNVQTCTASDVLDFGIMILEAITYQVFFVILITLLKTHLKDTLAKMSQDVLDQYIAGILRKRGIPRTVHRLLLCMICDAPISIERVKAKLRELLSSMHESKILVLGASQSGKSTFIDAAVQKRSTQERMCFNSQITSSSYHATHGYTSKYVADD